MPPCFYLHIKAKQHNFFSAQMVSQVDGTAAAAVIPAYVRWPFINPEIVIAIYLQQVFAKGVARLAGKNQAAKSFKALPICNGPGSIAVPANVNPGA